MTLRLDVPREQALERAAEIVARAAGAASTTRGRPSRRSTTALKELLEAALPEGATGVLEVLEDARRALDESIAQTRPRYFAFVASSGLEIGVIGDLLASCFDANLAVWAAAATEIEDQAVRWVAEFLGFPAAAGAFTSGGTVSNMTALAAARERAIPGSRRARPRRASGDALLLGRGALLDRAGRRDPRDRLRQRALAADRRRTAGSCPRRSRRRSVPTAPPGASPSPSSPPRGRR